jgi:DNA (cytosine-5)-methyltransferase 1
MPPIPIIDVFAGPGGLGEGFSSLPAGSSSSAFRLALSVEKEAVACRTLRLRAIRRRLSEAGHLDRYFELLRREISRADFDADPVVSEAAADADEEVLNAELGKTSAEVVDARIRTALGGCSSWVLIGGPPCQAYSFLNP